MKQIKILVCGGRDFEDQDFLFSKLNSIAKEVKIGQIIEGGARGADSLARHWAEMNGVSVKTFPANWREYRKAAGHIRNKQMLDEGKPDVVVAFDGGRGTQNMIQQAEKNSVHVIKFFKNR